MFAVGARLGARALTVILVCSLLASLAISVVWTPRNPVAAFYLLPARIFEFAIGALIASKSIAAPTSPALQALVRYLGLALLLSVFAVEIPRGQFPGYWAALPVVGTGLLILAGEAGSRPRFLQTSPGVFLGDISYSLYLWHWPVYVCFRTLGYQSNTVAGWIGLFAISMALGSLSYRFVELPFRKNRTFWTPRRLVAGVGASLGVLMAAIGCLALMVPAMFSSPQASAETIFSEAGKINPRRAECFRGQDNKSIDPPYCRIGAANVEPSFLLWGDSHADAMMTAISDAAATAGKAGYFAGYSGCPPILGAKKYGDDGCARFTSRIHDYLAQNAKISDVVLVARWSAYVLGDDANLEARTKVFFDREPQGLGAAYREAFRATVCGLHAQGKRVFVLGPVPEVGVSVPSALAASQISWLHRIAGSARDIRVSTASYRERNAIILAAIGDAQQRCGINLLDTAKAMCASGLCEIQREGRPLYRDGDHLSEFGSHRLMPLFHDVFAN